MFMVLAQLNERKGDKIMQDFEGVPIAHKIQTVFPPLYAW